MNLTLFPDGVQNPANLARIQDAADLLGASCSSHVCGRLIACENAPGAHTIYGRRPLWGNATLAVGNERRGLSRRTLDRANETVIIPTLSRTVTTLNVAAAAAVAAWYVLRGSGAQPRATRPETRRPAVLMVGDDHVEVGSSLRSAAAFGFRDVLLEDRGAGWFEGPTAVRREALAAARRHKNPLRVHRATLQSIAHFDEIVVVTPWGNGTPIHRERLAHGQRQLVIVGARAEDVSGIAPDRARLATLDLRPVQRKPLRLVASILLAEIARQVGRPRPIPGRPRPPALEYRFALPAAPDAEVLVLQASELLAY